MVDSVVQVYPVIWQGEHLLLINQARLPNEYSYVEVSRCEDVAEAIRTTMVRGEAVGIAAAYGLYLGSQNFKGSRDDFFRQLDAIAQTLQAACPSIIDLAWAIDRMLKTARQTVGSIEHLQQTLLDTAQTIHAENLQICEAIGAHGLQALPPEPDQLTLLTHANAGALAAAGYGTALGIVRSAQNSGRLTQLYVTETRPRFQGSRLSAWECVQEEIPVTIIADSAAAYCMQKGLIDAVVVGADRIAANGDVANRIGTYNLAIAAKTHGIPFLVAAPEFVIDFNCQDGSQITIEERDPQDICKIGELKLCPPRAKVFNPALDITPAAFITAIVTQHGALSARELNALRKQ